MCEIGSVKNVTDKRLIYVFAFCGCVGVFYVMTRHFASLLQPFCFAFATASLRCHCGIVLLLLLPLLAHSAIRGLAKTANTGDILGRESWPQDAFSLTGGL